MPAKILSITKDLTMIITVFIAIVLFAICPPIVLVPLLLYLSFSREFRTVSVLETIVSGLKHACVAFPIAVLFGIFPPAVIAGGCAYLSWGMRSDRA